MGKEWNPDDQVFSSTYLPRRPSNGIPFVMVGGAQILLLVDEALSLQIIPVCRDLRKEFAMLWES